jgi:SAM-dependent methyltransferase
MRPCVDSAELSDAAGWDARYLSGDAPWETGITPPEVVALVHSGRPNPGWALDIGCGSGATSRFLAGHGYRVLGIDWSPVALGRARRQAAEVGALCHFVRADAAHLPFGELDATLAVDVGCFHGLRSQARTTYITSLARLLVSGAHYLLYGFVALAEDLAGPEASLPEITPADIAGFAPYFALQRSAYGHDRDRAAAWFYMQRR